MTFRMIAIFTGVLGLCSCSQSTENASETNHPATTSANEAQRLRPKRPPRMRRRTSVCPTIALRSKNQRAHRPEER